MQIKLNKDNEKEMMLKYGEALSTGAATLGYNVYVDGQFVTDCSPFNVHEVLKAYEPLGKLTLESYINDGTEHQVRREK
jgi:hypothetical protein